MRTRTLGLSLLSVSLWAPFAMAQRPSPLTDEMIEEKRKKEAAPAPSLDQDRTGGQFIDNPEWLAEEIEASERAERGEAEQRAQKERGDSYKKPSYVPGYRAEVGAGLSPLAPQGQVLAPGATTPSFGSRDENSGYRFGFHGYVQSGLRAGLGSRKDALDGQSRSTLHGDPVVPGAAFGWFDHTNVVPAPWAQLNFEFGDDVVKATAILGAWSFSRADEASGYFQAPAQLGFNSAFLTYTPRTGPIELQVKAGVFTERYGAMGEYDTGAYGLAFIGMVQGTGASAAVALPFENDVTVHAEAGFKGDFNSPPVGIVSDQSNEYARSIEGSTYVGHGHLGLDYKERVEVHGHAIHSFSQDDRGDELEGGDIYLEDRPRKDGTLSVFGADLRFRLKEWGHLYVGGTRVVAKDATAVSNLVMVLNNGGGRDFNERFFRYESGGNGTLTLLGSQYTLSLGRLLRHPAPQVVRAPDLQISAFGVFAQQTSPLEELDGLKRAKFGARVFYSALSRLGAGLRADAVYPDLSESQRSFAVLSPELVFRNDWSNQATLTLRYSAYLLGSGARAEGDNRLLNNASGEPDRHSLALFGTLWW